MTAHATLKATLRKAIIKQARDFCINKPVITELVINDFKVLTGGGASYENAICLITDNYICPITRERKIDKYRASYDGKLTAAQVA